MDTLLLIGDTVLFISVLKLVTMAIEEVKECNHIEKELKRVLKTREAYFND